MVPDPMHLSLPQGVTAVSAPKKIAKGGIVVLLADITVKLALFAGAATAVTKSFKALAERRRKGTKKK